jgi:hypothetical protein
MRGRDGKREREIERERGGGGGERRVEGGRKGVRDRRGIERDWGIVVELGMDK